ncbi:MAG: type II toxin-antitoxin system Phd/YefM family antitoxin [Solirubrobacteraceae bacterium]
MREVGVRELKASLSEMLRAAGRGEHVRVTVHGRPVADIVAPGAVPGDDRLRSLVIEGRLVPPSRARPDRAPRLARTARRASALVLAERDAER